MDPLYANYDKRKNSQENSTPTPTPSASMPVFGMPMNSTPSPFAPTPASSPEPATPIRPVASSNFEPAKPIVSADPVSTQPNPFASQQQIPFSGKGDIVLNMNQPKQSKKGLFIALAGLAVAAAVALVVMVMMPKNGHSQAFEENMRAFSNFLCNGDPNNSECEEPNTYLASIYQNESLEERAAKSAELIELLKNLKNSASDEGNITKNIVSIAFDAANGFAALNMANQRITSHTIKEMYADGYSKDAMLDFVDQNYDMAIAADNKFSNKVIDSVKNLAINIYTLYDARADAGYDIIDGYICGGVIEEQLCENTINAERSLVLANKTLYSNIYSANIIMWNGVSE